MTFPGFILHIWIDGIQDLAIRWFFDGTVTGLYRDDKLYSPSRIRPAQDIVKSGILSDQKAGFSSCAFPC